MSLINNNTYGDSTIKIKTLEKEYEVLSQQYLEAKNNYIQALQDNAKGVSNFVIKDKIALVGDKFKIINDVQNVEKCKALCIENKCKGATYIHKSKVCELGNLNLNDFKTVENAKTTSIIPSHIDKLQIMEQLISKLLSINRQIMQNIEDTNPAYVKDIETKKTRADELYKNYKSLIGERENINLQLERYNMLSHQYTEENAKTNYQYFILNIWFFIVMILVLFALKEMFDIPVSFVTVFFGTVVFFLTLNAGVPIGFLIWLGAIALLLLIYSKTN